MASNQPPVVLVHGMGSNFEHNWRRHGWVDLLDDAGRRVSGFDMPGHGTSPALGANGDSGVDRLLAHCDLVGEGGPVDIVSFSAGSVLTLTALTVRPDLFRRAALLGLADTQLQISVESMRAGASDLTNPVMRTVLVAAERAGNNPQTVLDWAQRSDAPPSFADLARVSADVLLVLGEHDFLGSPARLLETLPQARLVTLPGVDHFATTSKAEAKRSVLEFLTA